MHLTHSQLWIISGIFFALVAMAITLILWRKGSSRICAACQHPNPPQAQFCGHCGQALRR